MLGGAGAEREGEGGQNTALLFTVEQFATKLAQTLLPLVDPGHAR